MAKEGCRFIVEETAGGDTVLLEECDTECEAEMKLCRYIYLEFDAYLCDERPEIGNHSIRT